MKTADIENEYTKNADLKNEDVNALLQWVQKQPHLPQINELQAIIFLQSCYYRNEAAKSAIDAYFTIRTLCPEIFSNCNPLEPPLREALNVSINYASPKKTPEGYTVLYAKLMDANPDNYNFPLALRYFDMATLLHLHQHGTSNGHVIVFDMEGCQFGHVTKLGPIVMKKFLHYLQEAMPVRLKGIHYVNVVSFMDRVLALMRPFMKKELMNVLYLHNSVDDLVKMIPRECLPQEYGGSIEAVPILHEKSKQNLRDNISFFADHEKMVVDETKRPGKPKNAGDVFGMEGTFKKLDID